MPTFDVLEEGPVGNDGGWSWLRALSLELTNLELNNFAKSRVVNHPMGWAAWRTVAAVYFFAIFCASIDEMEQEGNGAWWLIYLTHWTLTVQVVYLVLAAACTWKYGLGQGELTQLPWLYAFTWILQNVLLAGTFLVFLLYWTLVYTGGAVPFLTTQVHGANFIAMLIDRFFTLQPVRFAHFYMPVLYAFTYFIWSIIQLYSGVDNGDYEGEAVYTATDYKAKPSNYVLMLFLVFVGTPVVYWVMCAWAVLASHLLPSIKSTPIAPSSGPSSARAS